MSKNLPSLAQQLMFDPLSYVHTERFSLKEQRLSLKQRTAINDILLSSYQLTTENPLLAPGSLGAMLAKQWVQLPQIAFLIGCQRLRAPLAARGALLQLPESARRFVQMPMRASVATNMMVSAANLLSEKHLLAHGLAELLSWKNCLPIWLWQRLPLLFTPHSEALLQSGAIQTPHLKNSPDITLFILAGQYAKNYSDISTVNAA